MPSTVDMDVDVVHTYIQLEVVDESCVGLEDLNSTFTLVDAFWLIRMNLNLGRLGSYLTDSNSSIIGENISHI